MSNSRYIDNDVAIDSVARCRKDAIKSFIGGHRKPFYPDEHDAYSVVDVCFPDTDRARVKFVKDGELYRVIYLPVP